MLDCAGCALSDAACRWFVGVGALGWLCVRFVACSSRRHGHDLCDAVLRGLACGFLMTDEVHARDCTLGCRDLRCAWYST